MWQSKALSASLLKFSLHQSLMLPESAHCFSRLLPLPQLIQQNANLQLCSYPLSTLVQSLRFTASIGIILKDFVCSILYPGLRQFTIMFLPSVYLGAKSQIYSFNRHHFERLCLQHTLSRPSSIYNYVLTLCLPWCKVSDLQLQ